MCSLADVIYQVKNDAPELGKRFDKAVAIWQRGDVVEVEPNHWQVVSASEPGKVYNVNFCVSWSCDCADCQNGAPLTWLAGAQQKTCKHQVAAALEWLTR